MTLRYFITQTRTNHGELIIRYSHVNGNRVLPLYASTDTTVSHYGYRLPIIHVLTVILTAVVNPGVILTAVVNHLLQNCQIYTALHTSLQCPKWVFSHKEGILGTRVLKLTYDKWTYEYWRPAYRSKPPK